MRVHFDQGRSDWARLHVCQLPDFPLPPPVVAVMATVMRTMWRAMVTVMVVVVAIVLTDGITGNTDGYSTKSSRGWINRLNWPAVSVIGRGAAGKSYCDE